MKIDRLMSIVITLLKDKKTTARDLADKFDVSVRTIKRDIDTLTMAGIPIYSSSGRSGGYGILDSYIMKENYLNKSESELLTSLLEGLSATLPNAEMIGLKEKFLLMTNNENSSSKYVFVASNFSENFKLINEKTTLIAGAIDDNRKLDIQYINSNFKISKRIVHPYKLVMIGSSWYVYGFCALKNDFRLFKLFRIRSIKVSDKRYKIRELPKKKPWENDVFMNSSNTKVTIILDKKMVTKISDYIDYDMCKMTNEGIKVTFNYPVDEWFYSFLQSFVPNIIDLEPDYVKEELIGRMKKQISTLSS